MTYLQLQEKQIWISLRTKGDMELDQYMENDVNVSVLSFKIKKHKFSFIVKVQSLFEFQVKSILLRGRERSEELCLTFNIKKQSSKEVVLCVTLDLDELKPGPIYWDFYMAIAIGKKVQCVQIKNPVLLVLVKLSSRFYSIVKEGKLYYPYIATQRTISLCVRPVHQYDGVTYIFKELMAILLHCVIGGRLRRKKIWLIYEKFCETAQDNSFYFFKYCYENSDKTNVYYVIKKDSKDFKYVEPYKSKVISFMSIKHILYMLNCELVISSESKTHGYIWRENRGIIRRVFNKKKHVFLQHGVIGLKRVDSLFHKRSANETKLFIVSSEFEKALVEENLHYSSEEIAVTGLARWDHVPVSKNNDLKQILLFPTWRSWLDEVDRKGFINSTYYKKYSELLASEQLKWLLETHNIILKCCLHPKFREHTDAFKKVWHKKIEIITYEDERIIDLIHNSNLLITDYSSIAWDMFYLGKPVIFYQFDIEEYMRYQGSYLDPEELFGDRYDRADELVEGLEEYVKRGFKEQGHYSVLRSKYFSYSDLNNCERIYNAIVTLMKNTLK